MHGFPYGIVAPEGEAEVRYSAGSAAVGEVLLYPPYGIDEVYPVAGVFRDSGADGENVDVEYDVLGGDSYARQKVISSLADGYLSFVCRGLTFLVESHDHHGRSE